MTKDAGIVGKDRRTANDDRRAIGKPSLPDDPIDRRAPQPAMGIAFALVLGTIVSVWQALQANAKGRDAEIARQDAVTAREETEYARYISQVGLAAANLEQHFYLPGTVFFIRHVMLKCFLLGIIKLCRPVTSLTRVLCRAQVF